MSESVKDGEKCHNSKVKFMFCLGQLVVQGTL
jgi:hypothetical protein